MTILSVSHLYGTIFRMKNQSRVSMVAGDSYRKDFLKIFVWQKINQGKKVLILGDGKRNSLPVLKKHPSFREFALKFFEDDWDTKYISTEYVSMIFASKIRDILDDLVEEDFYPDIVIFRNIDKMPSVLRYRYNISEFFAKLHYLADEYFFRFIVFAGVHRIQSFDEFDIDFNFMSLTAINAVFRLNSKKYLKNKNKFLFTSLQELKEIINNKIKELIKPFIRSRKIKKNKQVIEKKKQAIEENKQGRKEQKMEYKVGDKVDVSKSKISSVKKLFKRVNFYLDKHNNLTKKEIQKIKEATENKRKTIMEEGFFIADELDIYYIKNLQVTEKQYWEKQVNLLINSFFEEEGKENIKRIFNSDIKALKAKGVQKWIYLVLLVNFWDVEENTFINNSVEVVLDTDPYPKTNDPFLLGKLINWAIFRFKSIKQEKKQKNKKKTKKKLKKIFNN